MPLSALAHADVRALGWEHLLMSDGPVLRATSESGDTVDDPSEDLLFMMFETLEAGESTFLIVDSLTSDESYAQAWRNEDGTYVVEYRDGGPERHYVGKAQDMRAAHTLITGWAFDVSGWRDSTTWRPLSV